MARSGFIIETGRRLMTGGPTYYLWMTLLTVLAAIGIASYVKQLQVGLIATGMQNYVSWGLYIGNFTFLVGVAAAAVLLIIPAYLYDFGPIKEIVIVAEVLAVCALLMCLMFVTADLGRPDRFWHLIPGLGILSLPRSLLAWDIVVLNGYLFLNIVHSGLSALGRLPRPSGEHEIHSAVHTLVDPMGGEHPHGHCIYLQRTGRTPFLECVDSSAPFPCFRFLFRACTGDITLPIR